MKVKNFKTLTETYPLTSYVQIESKVSLDNQLDEFILDHEPDKTHKYSLSTLILPTKEPILITTGSLIANLLTQEEISELCNKEFFQLKSKKIMSKARFLLHWKPKSLLGLEDEKYIELKPEFLLFPKELGQNFAEIFRFKAKPQKEPFNLQKHPVSASYISPYSLNFCLLTLKPVLNDALSSIPQGIQLLNISDRPFQGQIIYTISSPYMLISPQLCKNSLHVGHISKVAFKTSRKMLGWYKNEYIFLVNSTFKKGEEGSPVFNEYLEVIGLVLGNIIPYKQDIVGFNVCISTLPIMDLLFKISSLQSGINIWDLAASNFRPFVRGFPIKGVLSRVVKIISGSTIGSGVLINAKGYILTNRHVLKESSTSHFTIEISYEGQIDYELYDAEVYIVSKGDLDIALLKVTKELNEKTLKVLKQTKRFLDHPIDVRYLQGNEVYAIGCTFPQLNNVDFKTMITKGHLSKVVIHKNRPFLILTSCPIYNGFSGGAIVSNRGEFLGLITYNFTHSKKGILNDLSFSYCYSIFKELLDVIEDKNEEKIKELLLWNYEDKYVEKMAVSQTIEYVPKFEIESKL